MKVKIYAPAFLSFENIDCNGFMKLKEDSALSDVYKELKVPLALRPILLCSVNYSKAKLNTRLKDGDVISIFFPMTGG